MPFETVFLVSIFSNGYEVLWDALACCRHEFNFPIFTQNFIGKYALG